MALTTLTNIAKANGLYDDTLTPIESTPVDVIMLSDLTIEKTADKSIWATGELTYTVTISNQEDEPYTNVTFTDVLDPTLVILVSDSVELDGIPATYTYDDSTGLLTVPFPNDMELGTSVITFRVAKKQST